MEKMDKIFWQDQKNQLRELATRNLSRSEFIDAALKNIVESLELVRATHLTCSLPANTLTYDVSAETYPKDREYIPKKSSELTLLLVDIILENQENRYLQKTLDIDEDMLDVHAFQIRLPDTPAEHILVLTTSIENKLAEPNDEGKQAAYDYVSHFVELIDSL